MSESRHTAGPLRAEGNRRGEYSVYAAGEAITGWGCVVQSEANARLLAAAYTSYDRNCGQAAVDAAEQDLLGEALAALRYIVGWNTSFWSAEHARDLAAAVLAKAKGAE